MQKVPSETRLSKCCCVASGKLLSLCGAAIPSHTAEELTAPVSRLLLATPITGSVPSGNCSLGSASAVALASKGRPGRAGGEASHSRCWSDQVCPRPCLCAPRQGGHSQELSSLCSSARELPDPSALPGRSHLGSVADQLPPSRQPWPQQRALGAEEGHLVMGQGQRCPIRKPEGVWAEEKTPGLLDLLVPVLELWMTPGKFQSSSGLGFLIFRMKCGCETRVCKVPGTARASINLSSPRSGAGVPGDARQAAHVRVCACTRSLRRGPYFLI